MWEVSPEFLFSMQDAQLAEIAGAEALDEGFFPSRWERTTPVEKRFLTAMAGFIRRTVAPENLE